MANEISKIDRVGLDAKTIESVLIKGDLETLSPEQRLSYYNAVCESVGLNSLTKPFEYIKLNNRLVLYATRSCTDQLRKIYSISIKISARESIGEVYVVTAQAKDLSGREDESTGAVAVSSLKGENLANAYLKAETKAKRRVTLSICGLGLLDESEVESIPEAKRINEEAAPINKQTANGSADPLDFRLPPSWKRDGGRSLRELGVDGCYRLQEWLMGLENPSSQMREVLEKVSQVLGRHEAKSMPGEEVRQ